MRLNCLLANTGLCLILVMTGMPVFAQSFDPAAAHIHRVVRTDTNIDPTNFDVCSQYGCKKITRVSIDDTSWENMTALFSQAVGTPAYERALLVQYIAYMEQIIGRQNRTQFDRGGTFTVLFSAGKQVSNQMDCIDESTNTLSYLKMLAAQGLIKHHEVTGVVTRGGVLAGYPHTAVLLIDKVSKQKFVIDSWFYDNGRPAVVLPVKQWKLGWKPVSEIEE